MAWFKKRNGWGGWGAYVGFYTGIVALFFPGVVFIMGAGFVFGFWRGLLAVWIGGAVQHLETQGAMCATLRSDLEVRVV